ncbi:MAG: AAA family ATPase [Oscillospiraceae bacterium]|nr:AAA family ATPase [Oscillospiraceae bacterium]
MKIRKLRASFGKLQGETLSLHGGLNVIYAPNESGKSTWCAFIRTMLYGIDPAEQTALPDRTRYAPWSGAPMEGTMDVTADGCDMTLTRTTVSRNAPMREFTAVYSGTNTPVEGMTGSNCGELLTGVNRDVFCRSAFIGQGDVAVTGNPELEKRIQSIVSSGDEQVSYSETAERLQNWQHKRRYHHKGILPALEDEIAESKKLLSEMENSVSSVQEMESRLAEARQECSALEQQVTEARRRQRTDALNRLRDGRTLVQERSDSHDAALAEVSRARDALRRSEFGDYTGDELQAEIEKDRAVLETLDEKEPTGRSGLFPAVVCSFLAILTAAFYGVTAKLPLILAAGVCCVFAILFFLRYSRMRQETQTVSAERDQILRKYKISVPDDLDAILEKHLALEKDIRLAEEEERRSRERLENAGRQLHALEESAVTELDFAGGDSEASRLSRQLQQRRNEAAELSSKISGLNGRLSALGDPLVLASSISYLQERCDTIQGEYEAITLASELLRDADTEIKSRFSPELSKLAAEYMSEMTGGRYEDILIGSDFSARARAVDDSEAHAAEYLSAGTMDLLYLAVRLAVCELALPLGEPCPLILDDVLVNLDNTRYEQAMNLLKKLALRRQIVLFTCRRE